MIYKLIDTPIFRSQIDRRSLRQKKYDTERQEKKRQQMEELFAVEQLVKMGFYEKKEKPKPYGVEVKWKSREQLDADNWSVQKNYALKITLAVPQHQTKKGIPELYLAWNEEYQSFTQTYEIYYTKAALWIALDFLNRVIDLHCWDEVREIPLYWDVVGNEKVTEFAVGQVANINNRSFSLSLPPPPRLSDIKQRALRHSELLMPMDKREGIIKDEKRLICGFIRHQYTPYDYLYRTNKMSFEEAKILCNGLIKEVYPELFDS